MDQVAFCSRPALPASSWTSYNTCWDSICGEQTVCLLVRQSVYCVYQIELGFFPGCVTLKWVGAATLLILGADV